MTREECAAAVRSYSYYVARNAAIEGLDAGYFSIEELRGFATVLSVDSLPVRLGGKPQMIGVEGWDAMCRASGHA